MGRRREGASEPTGPDYRGRVLESARQAIAPMLRWSGSMTMVIATLDAILPPPSDLAFSGAFIAVGGALFGLGLGLRNPRVPGAAIPWIFTAALLLFQGVQLVEYVRRPDGWGLVYIGVLITAFAPLTFGWVPFLTGGSLMLAATVAALRVANTPYMADWALSIVGALGAGAILLQLRLHAVHELADSEFAREQLVETDPLTGLLNRRGMRSRLKTAWAGAQRQGEPVYVAFIDIVGMKTVNDEHGHDLGDHTITEVGHAIRGAVRGEDLVARWGGDEFLVLAKGEIPSEPELHERISATLRMRDAECVGHQHCDVTVGIASSAPDQCGFDELVGRADQRMYAQRRYRLTDRNRGAARPPRSSRRAGAARISP